MSILSNLELLAISYSFPPMAYPRSIQVARLLSALDASVTVICGEEDQAYTPYGRDTTIASGIEGRLKRITREPFHRPKILRYIDSLAERFFISRSKLPDPQRSWVARTTRGFLKWQRRSGYEPDLVVTFGFPMSDHFFGLEYKKRKGTAWIAHFSDPWVDNPYRNHNSPTAWLNRRMERDIISKADGVIFTSPETLDLVMKKYPDSWREKSFYLPHCYDRENYDETLSPPVDHYVLRSIGTLYGGRSADPIFQAIERISAEAPSLLENVILDFVGFVDGGGDILRDFPVAQRITRLVGVTPHAEALRLMQTSHCLLVIDAPAELSVFFPSKLAEYLGSGRFIFALSPKGATSRIVKEAGGLVANPSRIDETYDRFRLILEKRPGNLRPTPQYNKEVVSKEFLRIAKLVMHKSAKDKLWESYCLRATDL